MRNIAPATIRGLLGQPWSITPAGRTEVLATALLALQAREPLPLRAAQKASVRDGVAILAVDGVLFSQPSWCGTDYATLAQDLTTALDDPEVSAIVLDVDSPGGLVAGVHELAAAILAGRARKPIAAYVGGTGASAAYWLASACNEVVISPTALLGSIGCCVSLVDQTLMLAKLGIKVYDIASKQSPNKVLDPTKAEDRLRMRDMVTALADVFIGDVAAGRGVSTSRVVEDFGKGDLLVGAAAVRAGLADRTGNFESLLAEMAGRPSSRVASATRATSTARKVIAMSTKKLPDAAEIERRITALERVSRPSLPAAAVAQLRRNVRATEQVRVEQQRAALDKALETVSANSGRDAKKLREFYDEQVAKGAMPPMSRTGALADAEPTAEEIAAAKRIGMSETEFRKARAQYRATLGIE